MSLLFVLVAMATTASITPTTDLHALYKGLEGACWQNTMQTGSTDTHCFSVASKGHIALDIQKLRNADGVMVYQGATLTRLPPNSTMAEYGYFADNGELSLFAVRREENQIVFYNPEKPMTALATWEISTTSYDTVSPEGVHQTFIKISDYNDGL